MHIVFPVSTRAARLLASLCAASVLGGCTVPEQPGTQPDQPAIEMPLTPGWFEGQRVFYVTTDMSAAPMAQDTGTNFAPRLNNALPQTPPVPGRGTPVDLIYKFFDGSQPSVLPSAPAPLGGNSTNKAYSPLWQLVKVTWRPGASRVELRSAEEVLEAADAGRVTLEVLPIIVNCPVVQLGDRTLPGTRRVR